MLYWNHSTVMLMFVQSHLTPLIYSPVVLGITLSRSGTRTRVISWEVSLAIVMKFTQLLLTRITCLPVVLMTRPSSFGTRTQVRTLTGHGKLVYIVTFDLFACQRFLGWYHQDLEQKLGRSVVDSHWPWWRGQSVAFDSIYLLASGSDDETIKI